MNYNQKQKIPNNFPKFQEDLIEVMRDVMIWNLEKEKADIEAALAKGKLRAGASDEPDAGPSGKGVE